GFTTRTGGVSVHRADCTNADELRQQADRMVNVEWKPTAASMFLVAIQVEALDRHKLLADVTRVLSEERVNILSATVTTTRDRVAVSRFTFEMADPKHLGHLVAAVRKVDGVFDAYRVTSGASPPPPPPPPPPPTPPSPRGGRAPPAAQVALRASGRPVGVRAGRRGGVARRADRERGPAVVWGSAGASFASAMRFSSASPAGCEREVGRRLKAGRHAL